MHLASEPHDAPTRPGHDTTSHYLPSSTDRRKRSSLLRPLRTEASRRETRQPWPARSRGRPAKRLPARDASAYLIGGNSRRVCKSLSLKLQVAWVLCVATGPAARGRGEPHRDGLALSLMHQSLYEDRKVQYINLDIFLNQLGREFPQSGWRGFPASVARSRAERSDIDIHIPPARRGARHMAPPAKRRGVAATREGHHCPRMGGNRGTRGASLAGGSGVHAPRKPCCASAGPPPWRRRGAGNRISSRIETNEARNGSGFFVSRGNPTGCG
jgi:hypothetical protein